MNHTEHQVALAELGGEVAIPDGEIWLSTPNGNGESITGIHTTTTTAATLLVTPNVREWTAKTVEADVLFMALGAFIQSHTHAHVSGHIDQVAIHSGDPQWRHVLPAGALKKPPPNQTVVQANRPDRRPGFVPIMAIGNYDAQAALKRRIRNLGDLHLTGHATHRPQGQPQAVGDPVRAWNTRRAYDH